MIPLCKLSGAEAELRDGSAELQELKMCWWKFKSGAATKDYDKCS